MLKAGFSKICISPAVGAPLAGFAAREGVSEGVHDDLFARSLVLANEYNAIALVSVDVLALPGEFISRIRREVHARTGITEEAIMIASTHTHAGPVTIKTFFNPDGSVDPDYMDELASAIEESVFRAWNSQFTASIGVGAGIVAGVGVNRRSPNQLPIDEEVGIIKVDDEAGRTRAVFINYSCHPTVLGPDNRLITGDFPNFAVARIEESLGVESFAMFVNGTQGNISMGHSSELSAIGIITPGRTFERAAELGQLLAAGTLTALPQIPTQNNISISALSRRINLPLKKFPPVEETTAELHEADAQLDALEQDSGSPREVSAAKSRRLYASITSFYARETRDHVNGQLPVELQGIRIGHACFVAVPAEVFVEIGLKLKREAPAKTFVVGIANGYIGYLPNREAYANGGYEVVSAKCAANAEEVLINETIALENELLALQDAPISRKVG